MPAIGDVLAERYRIDQLLGWGGSSMVYRAHDLRLDRTVALKALLPNLAQEPDVVARFEREARTLAALSHPAVVAVYDVDAGDPAAGREPWLVMELCSLGTLAGRLAREPGPLDPATVLPMLADVARGLAWLHERGLVHRDVKPHNVLLTERGAKLGDFGIARPGDATRLTAHGTALGTAGYLAPEVLRGERPTAAADVFALGATAFQALTGQLPDPAGAGARRALPPSVGPGVATLLERAVARDPARRPTASALAEALATWTPDAAAAPVNTEARTVETRVSAQRPWVAAAAGRRFPVPIVAAVGIALPLALVLVLLAAQPTGTGPGPSASPSPSVAPSESAATPASVSPSATPVASETLAPTIGSFPPASQGFPQLPGLTSPSP